MPVLEPVAHIAVEYRQAVVEDGKAVRLLHLVELVQQVENLIEIQRSTMR